MPLDLRPAPQVKVAIKGPSWQQRIFSRWNWLNHTVTAYDQFNKQHGNYFASGATYNAVLAIFPILMVTLSVCSLILHNHQNILLYVEDRMSEWLTQATHSNQISHVIDLIVQKRNTVGTVGLLGMLYTGLNFISSLREALTYQWGGEPIKKNFFMRKLNDFVSLVGLFLVMLLIITLNFISKEDTWGKIRLFHRLISMFGDESIRTITILSQVFHALLLFMMWTYVIARLPRIQIPFRNAYKAGLLMTVLFMIFVKLVGILIAQIRRNPILGLFVFVFTIMLFLYWTFRLLLFCTSWAATTPENRKFLSAPQLPDPVIISPIITNEQTTPPAMTALTVVTVISAILTLFGFSFRKHHSKP